MFTGIDLNNLTVQQCDEILALTGVDVMAPPELVSFAKRYAALGFYRRHMAGERITFAEVIDAPVAESVMAMTGGTAADPTNRAARRAAARDSGKKAAPSKKAAPAKRKPRSE